MDGGDDDEEMRQSMAKCWGGYHGQGCTEDGDHPIASYMPLKRDEIYFEVLAEVNFDDGDVMSMNENDYEILDCYFHLLLRSDYSYFSCCNCYYYFLHLPRHPNFPPGLNIVAWSLMLQLEGQI